MSITRRIGRRHFLRGLGGVGLALPMLDYFGGTARAELVMGGPKRLIVFYHYQGTAKRHAAIAGQTPEAFSLGSVYSALEPWRDRCLFFNGLDNKIAKMSNTNGHISSERSCLTANLMTKALQNGNYVPLEQQTEEDSHAAGPSIDQVIADRIRDGHPFKSIEIGVGSGSGTGLLYAGNDDPVSFETDPYENLQRLFPEEEGTDEEIQRLRARRLSVLDGVLDNFTVLQGRVGAEDRMRLEAHADKVREIEQRISAGLGECTEPMFSLPGDYDHEVDDVLSAPVQIDILVAAMQCGLAPVGSLSFTTGHSPFVGWTYGPNNDPIVPPEYDNWHDMVHRGRDLGPNEDQEEPGLLAGYTFYSEQFAYLLEQLDARPEDDGTMLDNTLILWMSDFGDGYGHNNLNMHAILAGNVGPTVQMGRLLEWVDPGKYQVSDYSTNQLFVTMLRAFGEQDDTFGWQEGQNGPITSGVLPDVF